MKRLRPPIAVLSTFLLLTGACLSPANAEEGVSSIKLSDPAKPARVEIIIARGNLRVQGADTNEVTVKSAVKPTTAAPRKDGLRVISGSPGYVLTEKDNLITLDATSDGGKSGGVDFSLTVPRGAAIVAQNGLGGNITCAGVTGNLEVNNLNGVIRLDDVSGGVVASTMNGEIRATIRELREGNAVSFTSMNGEVELRLPVDAKANVRLRTQNGSVLTDFDDSVLVTKTETSPRSEAKYRHAYVGKSSSSKVMTEEVHEAIREAAQVSATAVREAMTAVRQGLDAAREESSRSRSESSSNPVPPVPPGTPRPFKAPPALTITGGKLVTGTLNGGGPEISVSTMNGDVTLRKADSAK